MFSRHYRDSAFLDIELKVSGLEKITAVLLQKHAPSRRLVVSSFLAEVIEALHAEDTAIPLGLICETKAELRWNGLPIEYLIPHYKLIDSPLVRELRNASKRILVWTVNTPADIRRFAEQGVDGIISDDTSLLCRLLGR